MAEKPVIPEWMQTTEQYDPPKDADGFTTKSLLSVMGVLAKARNSVIQPFIQANAPVVLLTVLLLVLLTACSHNMFFSYCMLALVLIALITLPGKQVKQAVSGALAAVGISAMLLLPAVFLGSPKSLLTVTIKVFISVGLINYMSATVPWNKLTQGLRTFHVPNLFIFTLDITLKYIVMLGDVCVNMLQALKMRSVGKNRAKAQSFSGVLGMTFLKSRELSDEMYNAMVCRGFEGEYDTKRHFSFQKGDAAYFLLDVLAIILFVFLERAM